MRLLGPTRLSATAGVIEGIERKMAALLAYLALEGPTPRQKLAGLLWPEAPESNARNNLRQLLHRLRRVAGDEVVVLDDPLRLGNGVAVDVLELLEHARQGRAKEVLRFPGGLLADLEYDDNPGLAEWVEAERERLSGLRQRALEVELVRLEREGEYDSALEYAEALLGADPASEQTYRSLMRLHHLRGDRTAALRVFERCQAALELHLGVEPLPETLELARQIEAGGSTPTVAQRRIPLSVLRPPVLAGREREWARLEAAWQARLGIFVSGEPGVGKSRLVMDFATATSAGRVFRLEGRPGDAEVPYSTFTRHLRQHLDQIGMERFEPWVRRELSRLIPALWPDPAPPITSDAEKLRLFDAVAEVLLGLHHQFCFVVDDVQYHDPASFELVMHFNRRFAGGREALVPGMILVFRTGELQAKTEALMRQMVDTGLAGLVELEPLAPRDVKVMLAGFNRPGFAGLGGALSSFTGGNPLFIVETLKGLIESGELEGDQPPARFAVPEKVGSIIGKRLEHLSPEALKLARLTAVARTDFDLELAGKVLQTDALDLAIPYGELEAAQIWRDQWFTHDLIYETLRQTTPDALRQLLHARTAKALEELEGDPARIAEHWMEAEQPLQAAPWWMRAAKLAEAKFRLDEAAGFIGQGVAVWERQGDRQATFATLYEAALIHILRHNMDDLAASIERLSTLEETAVQKAHVWLLRATRHNNLGEGAAAIEAAQRGLEQARQAGDVEVELELLNREAIALRLLGRLEEAATRCREVLAREAFARSDLMAVAAGNLAVVLNQLELRHEATPYYLKAIEYSARSDYPQDQTVLLSNLSVNQVELGLVVEAVTTLNRALALSGGADNEPDSKIGPLGQLGLCLGLLGEYRQAIHYLELALESAHRQKSWIEGPLLSIWSRINLTLGDVHRAEDQLEQALAFPHLPGRRRATMLIAQANLLLDQGKAVDTVLSEAEALLTPGQQQYTWGYFWLTRAVQTGAAGLEDVRQALEVAEQKQLGGLWIAALTRQAQLLLAQGHAAQALESTGQAQELMKRYSPTNFYQGEVRWTHVRALEANAHPDAPQQRKALFDWLMDAADTKVPPEYRSSFLQNNPVNRAILERHQRS